MLQPESCRRFFREFRPLNEPLSNPLLNKPEPLEDKTSDRDGTRNIRSWARSVSAGTPASASSAPSSEAGLSAIDATTNRTKSSHEAHLYNSALNKNHMAFVTELRPDLEDVVAKLTKPLKVGEPLASDEDIVRKLDYLEMQLDILMDNISMIRKQHIDETPYEKTLDIAIPTNSFGISLALRCIRALKHTKPPEMDYLSSAINLAIRTEHYHNFFDWEVISTAKPGSIVGMPLSWLRDFVEEVICDDDIAYIITEKVWDSVRLCPAASLVFAPVIVEDNKDRQLQPINEAADQLRGAVAAALEANSPYLKDSNVVFGVAANLSVMFLYVAWREEAKSALRKPHYCFYRLRGFNLEEEADMRQAQHLLIRVYVWAARERRVAIEEELRPLLLKEKEEVLKRRDGTKEPGELDRGSE
ncbi:hypothetical protein F4821DRAFT_222934 [Hypoxylon rubiginosum]|uniref:Uncharacterized protein n=1 Tax=Hypoxylon rubiginosum TaxID=110542 RepID=A0ACC0DLQ7_9PEZI|nr:hypothetical protein F4821DRAFT_222934 [Hypoxylon rubiginosum]